MHICDSPLVAAAVLERDENEDVLWAWSYPSVDAELRAVVQPKAGLKPPLAATGDSTFHPHPPPPPTPPRHRRGCSKLPPPPLPPSRSAANLRSSRRPPPAAPIFRYGNFGGRWWYCLTSPAGTFEAALLPGRSAVAVMVEGRAFLPEWFRTVLEVGAGRWGGGAPALSGGRRR